MPQKGIRKITDRSAPMLTSLADKELELVLKVAFTTSSNAQKRHIQKDFNSKKYF